MMDQNKFPRLFLLGMALFYFGIGQITPYLGLSCDDAGSRLALAGLFSAIINAGLSIVDDANNGFFAMAQIMFALPLAASASYICSALLLTLLYFFGPAAVHVSVLGILSAPLVLAFWFFFCVAMLSACFSNN